MRRSIAMATACLIGSASIAPAQNRCAEEALKNYNSLNVALLREGPLMSAKALVSQRRLEEAYCHELALCIVHQPADQPVPEFARLPYLAAFAKCLRDEALEKYDAVERKQ